ncbi:DUF6164 family protein [Aliikangiella coralliicola]|uniref:DUF2007 domain-containing protein n=1 Tax=Aliikangiella coralliicola TaxID=2592383 RepID=A0A545UJS1_9GAMM|nr:DUF6164 family protein [Aliikangiella coralliicola]TQV89709.1 hypothetical protein FLL46_02165 [Aliikangiella coralliicola]
MAKLLFKLNSVPEDEADEIRLLLDESEINYYETSSGNWGLSFAAIWLNDEQQYEQAKQLIDQYQKERYQRVSEQRQAQRDAGEHTTLWQALKQSPIRFSAVIVFVSVVLYFSIIPFFPN